MTSVDPSGVGDVPVLVVEDDPELAALLEMTLTQAGHRVVVASDGEEALAVAHKLQPKLIVLDSSLPGCSGADVCRALRANIATAAASIIFVTGRQEVADVIAGFDAGADDCVVKPFQPEELLARARALLRRSQGLRGLSPFSGQADTFIIGRELRWLVDFLYRNG